MSEKILTGETATLLLGDVNLQVFDVPELAEYVYSQTSAAESVGLTERYTRDFLDSKWLKDLLGKEYTPAIQSIVTVKVGKTRIKAMPGMLVTLMWTYQVSKGNTEAIKLLAAIAAETLDRRSDKKFNRQRTEAEYNERTKERKNGKVCRRLLTDMIKEYCETHDKSQKYRAFVFSNCSDCVNRGLFGKTAKQLREMLGCTENNLRDHLPSLALRRINTVEDIATSRILYDDMEPLEACKNALSSAKYPVMEIGA